MFHSPGYDLYGFGAHVYIIAVIAVSLAQPFCDHEGLRAEVVACVDLGILAEPEAEICVILGTGFDKCDIDSCSIAAVRSSEIRGIDVLRIERRIKHILGVIDFRIGAGSIGILVGGGADCLIRRLFEQAVACGHGSPVCVIRRKHTGVEIVGAENIAFACRAVIGEGSCKLDVIHIELAVGITDDDLVGRGVDKAFILILEYGSPSRNTIILPITIRKPSLCQLYSSVVV